MGAGAKILGDILIGEGSAIGANAVVVRDVPPGSVAVGIPAEITTRAKVTEETGVQDGELNWVDPAIFI